MIKKQLLVLTIILLLQNSSAWLEVMEAIVTGAKLVVELIKTISSGAQSMKDLMATTESIGGTGSTNNNNNRQIEENRRELSTMFRKLDTKLDNLKLYIGDRFHKIEEVINHLPQILEVTLKKQIVGGFITNINNRWDQIMQFLEQGVDRSVYSYTMSAHLQYMEQNLMNFRFAISPDKTESLNTNGLLVGIAQMQKDQKDIMCNGQTSHHNIIHLSQMVMTTEIKAFILQALAFNEKFSENNAWVPLANYSFTTLNRQLQEYKKEIKIALDIDKHPYTKACNSDDQPFFYVTRINQLHYHLNTGTPSDESLRICYTLKPSSIGCDTLESIWGNYFKTNYFNKGYLIKYSDCTQDVSAPWEFYGREGRENGKLYYETSTDTDDCKIKNLEKYVDYHCYGWCRIYEKLIMSFMQSRVTKNYVVVAVRFRKTQNYNYIQIAEGKLEANGYISDFSWVEPTRKENGEDPFDAALTISERKTMALDDLQLPPNYVLTGIKFSREVISGDNGFRIGLHGVKLDYTTGQLYPTAETFVLASELKGTPYPLVEFRTTDYKHDNSPRELPALNAASVAPNPLSPIGGVGVFYEILQQKRTRQGSLSLRLYTIDYIVEVDNAEDFDPACSIIS